MGDDRAIGLPPPKDVAPPRPTPRMLWFARAVNLVGLVPPFSNLGLLRVAPRDRRWFGLGAGIVCLGVFLYARWRGIEWLQWTAGGVYVGLVVLGLFQPLWVARVGDAWAAFGTALGKVMVYPIFAVIYFGVVTPTGLLLRAFGKDPLARRAPPSGTYWVPHTPPAKERYERQF